jgi:ketopantoate reductase
MKHCTVIGGGRIGSFFADVLSASLITRDSGVLMREGPIILCVRNADLESVIKSIPPKRQNDLVFIQNGMIHPLLSRLGVHDSTCGILYFAIETRGAPPVDGGSSVFTGLHSDWMVAGLKVAGVQARSVSKQEYLTEMAIKLIWNSIFGLLGEVYQKNVGQIVEAHALEIKELSKELSEIIAREFQLALPEDLSERLISYAKKVNFYKTRATEWEYRNGWFLSIKKSPLHAALSRQIGK